MEKFSKKKQKISMIITSSFHLLMLIVYLVVDSGLIKGIDRFVHLAILGVFWSISFIISLVFCFMFKSVSWTSENDKGGYPIMSFVLFVARFVVIKFLASKDISFSFDIDLLVDAICVILLYILTVVEIYKWNDPFAGCGGGGGSEPVHKQIFREYGDYGD